MFEKHRFILNTVLSIFAVMFGMCCLAHEHMAELMPIFEQLRAKGEIGNAYPLHVGSTAGPTLHWTQANNPNSFHWVIHSFVSLCGFTGLGYFCCLVY